MGKILAYFMKWAISQIGRNMDIAWVDVIKGICRVSESNLRVLSQIFNIILLSPPTQTQDISLYDSA